MSTSDRAHLSVTAENPAVRMTVVDGELAVVENGVGVGNLDLDLPPGVYEVRFQAGASVREETVVLRPGASEHVHVDAMGFPTAAPLAKTRFAIGTHEGAAISLSRQVHHSWGDGGELFVFVRDTDRRARSNPARGLSLHRIDGEQIADFAEIAIESRSDEPRSAGCTLRLDAGPYRLRARGVDGGSQEQTVIVSDGWQTQVFLGRRDQLNGRGRRPHMAGAAVLMSRCGEGFDPGRPDLRAAELARQGLRYRREAVPKETLKEMLWRKFDNPMLGLYGAHLICRSSEPDRKLLRTVTGNLRALLHGHPDVNALQVFLGEQPSGPFAVPPMLANSWAIAITASAAQPELVPPGTLAAAIADRVLTGSTWLMWRTLPAPEHRSAPSVQPRVELGEAIVAMAEQIDDEAGGDLQPEVAVADYGSVAADMLSYARGVVALARGEGLSIEQAVPDDAELVKALAVPRVVAEAAVDVALDALGEPPKS